MTVTAAMPVIDMVATGRNIQRLREQNGMSVRDLQEKFGFSSPQSIYKWQWGQTLPDYQNMLFLAALWNVSVEEILVLENPDFFIRSHCFMMEVLGSPCMNRREQKELFYEQ